MASTGKEEAWSVYQMFAMTVEPVHVHEVGSAKSWKCGCSGRTSGDHVAPIIIYLVLRRAVWQP